MTPFLIFDIATGEIRRIGACSSPQSVPIQALEGEGVLSEGFDPELVSDQTHMVDLDTMRVEPRPGDGDPRTLNAQVGEEFVVAVPTGTGVRVVGQSRAQIVEDGSAEFTFVTPGPRTIEVTPPWPQRVYKIKVYVA